MPQRLNPSMLPPLPYGNGFVTQTNGQAAMAPWDPQITWFAIIFTGFQANYPLNLQVFSPLQDRMGVGRLAKVEIQMPFSHAQGPSIQQSVAVHSLKIKKACRKSWFVGGTHQKRRSSE